MNDNSSINGSRFLEGLIMRAEDLLQKMIRKLHNTNVSLREMIEMINSVHEFVNSWEVMLHDTQPETRLDPKKEIVVQDAQAQLVPNNAKGIETMEKISVETTAPLLLAEMESEPEFDYAEAPLDGYKPALPGYCNISHVLPQGDEFYMVDSNPKGLDITEILKTLQNLNPTLQSLPESSRTVFGACVEGTVWRAVRSTNADKCYIKLLDTGEVLPLDQSMAVYELPPYYAKLPPFAIRCQLINFEDTTQTYSGNKRAYLEASLFQARAYEIVTVEQSRLLVTLSQKPPVQPPPTSLIAQQQPNYKISLETLSQDQLDDLYEEPLNTTNAIKAVMGYVPQDDRRICPFYDPQIQGCFKGSRCRLEHVAKLSDGWTRDRSLHKTKIRAEMETPMVGSELVLIPTCIDNVDEFYAHIPLAELSEALVDLQKRLNDPKYTQDFGLLNHEPHFRELVFAKYAADGLWYRAEVLEFHSSDRISIFYVDYGNKDELDIDQLRYWDDRFDYLPFQAVHCRVANIKRIRNNHLEAVEQLRSAILDKGVKVRVIDNMSPWEVQIFDNEDNDIGDFLVMTKLAEPREPLVMAKHNNNLVPV